ncbi:matrixin family metalloprotease [Myxococcota bacterium]|nr:matrixin family metalloprotease [Myxococcota bacterium]
MVRRIVSEMSGPGPSLVRWCALVALTVAPSLAAAYECKVSESYSYVSLRWASRELPYSIEAPGSGQLSLADVTRAVDFAFEAWTLPDCTDLRFAAKGVVQPVDGDRTPRVTFVREGWTHAVDAVALTRTIYGVQDGDIRSAVIEVNEDRFAFRDVVTSGCPDGIRVYDLTAVLTHEVGHLIGLDHTKSYSGAPSDPTMAPVVDVCEIVKRTLEPDDVDGLCRLYPAGEPAGHCQDLPPTPADSYVSNTPLGCTDVAAVPGPSGLGALALVAPWLAWRRWKTSPNTCPGARSRR